MRKLDKHPKNEAFVIGTGIIGVICGLRMSEAGYSVTFIDEREPGTAASFGNAGSIASWGLVPETAPEVFRKALKWMLEPDGFVKLQPRYLPKMASWFYHYQKASRKSNVQASSKALMSLISHSHATLWPLVQRTNVADLVQKTAGLSVFFDSSSLDREVASLDAQKKLHALAFDYQVLTSDELRQMEPDMPETVKFGILKPDNAAVRNPKKLVETWYAQIIDREGSHTKACVTKLDHDAGRIETVHTSNGKAVLVKGCPVVIAAGAWSHVLTKQLGLSIPLRASRGYHLHFPDPPIEFRRTVLFEGSGFMMNHMATGLRFAGTVEYDHVDAPPNLRRIENLRRRVFSHFPELRNKDHSTWVGSRPSLPDSLPVISGTDKLENAFFAFGHGGLGIAQASATGALIADLATGKTPAIDIAPFRIDRF